MADDKKKEDQADAGKKKGLPAIVMIAIGAIVGGAGVVFAIPPKTIETVAPAPEFEEVVIRHPDAIQHTFNPQGRSGKSVAKVSFKFYYTVVQEVGKVDVKDAAFKLLKDNWEKAKGETYMYMLDRSYDDLRSASGKVIIVHDLKEILTHKLFPGEHAIARVSDLIITELLLQ